MRYAIVSTKIDPQTKKLAQETDPKVKESYQKDLDGLRDFEYSPKKPDGTYRILVIGDSIAYGWAVPLKGVYAKKLEEKLNQDPNSTRKYEVINLGVPGYNISQIVERLKEKGLK